MIDPNEAFSTRWAEYSQKSIPKNLYPSQEFALGDAYFHGMKGFSEILHEILSTEPAPTNKEIADFMVGLVSALCEFQKSSCSRESAKE